MITPGADSRPRLGARRYQETGKALGLRQQWCWPVGGALRQTVGCFYDGNADHRFWRRFCELRLFADSAFRELLHRDARGVAADVDDPWIVLRRSHDAPSTPSEVKPPIARTELSSRLTAYFPPAPSEALCFPLLSLATPEQCSQPSDLQRPRVPREHVSGRRCLVTEIYSVGPLTAGSA